MVALATGMRLPLPAMAPRGPGLPGPRGSRCPCGLGARRGPQGGLLTAGHGARAAPQTSVPLGPAGPLRGRAPPVAQDGGGRVGEGEAFAPFSSLEGRLAAVPRLC